MVKDFDSQPDLQPSLRALLRECSAKCTRKKERNDRMAALRCVADLIDDIAERRNAKEPDNIPNFPHKDTLLALRGQREAGGVLAWADAMVAIPKWSPPTRLTVLADSLQGNLLACCI